MSPKEILEIVGLVFAVGATYATMAAQVKQARADVNGLGKKYGRLVSLLILWADTDEKRAQLARAVEPQW
jgi:hypothetical protein